MIITIQQQATTMLMLKYLPKANYAVLLYTFLTQQKLRTNEKDIMTD